MILNIILTMANGSICVAVGMIVQQIRELQTARNDHESRIRALENKVR